MKLNPSSRGFRPISRKLSILGATALVSTGSRTSVGKLNSQRIRCFGLAGMMGLFSLAPNANAATYQGILTNVDADGDTFVDDLPIHKLSFTVTAGTTVVFDALVWDYNGLDWNNDGLFTGFDMYFQLYDSANNLIAANDDYSGVLNTNGSTHPFDSVIQATFPVAGSYFLAFGQLSFSTAEALQGYDQDRAFSDYESSDGQQNFSAWRIDTTVTGGIMSNIQITGGSAVPEPTSLVLAGLGALSLLRRRRTPGHPHLSSNQ
jgi:hypothetical protein